MGSITSSLQKKRQTLRVSDLLRGASVISQAQFNKAVEISQQTRQTFERVLVDFRFVSHDVMEAAVKLQLLNAESMLPTATAIKALSLVHQSNISVKEALAYIGWGSNKELQANDLGVLLLEAAVINQRTYENALRTSQEQCCSFGSFLVIRSIISYNILNASLQTLALVGQGKMNKSKAIALVKYVYETGMSVWEALSQAGISADTIASCQLSLGELLTQAGLVTELDRTALVEFSISENKMLGELVVNQGLASSQVLQGALVLQKLAKMGAISRSEACQVLKQISQGADLRTELSSRYGKAEKYLTQEAVELLLAGNFVQQAQIEKATNQADYYGLDLVRGLVLSGAIDGRQMLLVRDIALRVRLNVLPRDMAFVLLNYCDRARCTVDAGLAALEGQSGSSVEESNEEQAKVDAAPQANRPNIFSGVLLTASVLFAIAALLIGFTSIQPVYVILLCIAALGLDFLRRRSQAIKEQECF